MMPEVPSKFLLSAPLGAESIETQLSVCQMCVCASDVKIYYVFMEKVVAIFHTFFNFFLFIFFTFFFGKGQ